MRYFGLNRQFNWAARQDNVALSSKERDRLRALRRWQETGDVKLVCRTFGMSRATACDM
jgi:ribosomal protein S14